MLSYNQTISATTHEGLVEGIIHIDGYEYIGYFKEAELHPSRPASAEKSQTRQEESLVEIPFETITSLDANLAEGQTRIVTAGVNGKRRLVTKVSMVSGQEVREVIEDQSGSKNLFRRLLQSERRKRCKPTPNPQAETQLIK